MRAWEIPNWTTKNLRSKQWPAGNYIYLSNNVWTYHDKLLPEGISIHATAELMQHDDIEEYVPPSAWITSASLFTYQECYTREAKALFEEAHAALSKLFEKSLARKYPTREIATVIREALSDVELTNRC